MYIAKRKSQGTRKTPRKNKTLRKKENNGFKHKEIKNATKAKIVKKMLEMLHAIKLYHWKTTSYAHHQSTDELHEKISNQSDRFVEVLMGKTASRIQMVEEKMKLYDFATGSEFREKVFEFRQFLIDLDSIFPSKKDHDLRTIRDDMLESVNQFLYLFTLQK